MLKKIFSGTRSNRLILIFSLSALLITFTGIMIYSALEDKTRLDAYSQLSTLAKVKIREVMNWRLERINDATFIYHNEEFKKLAKEYLNNPNSKKAQQKAAGFLKSLKENHEYIDIMLISPSGRKYTLFDDGESVLLDKDKEYFLKALREKRVLLSDLNKHTQLSDSSIHLSSFIPLLHSEKGNVFCVVEIKMDPGKILFPAIQQSSDSHETSETFLVEKDSGFVLFLNDLKYKKNAALNFRVPLTRKDLPAVMAVLGKDGIFEGTDYRGVKVLADLDSIPDSPWYIVSKIDLDELYEPLKLEAVIVAGFVVLLILLSGSIVYAIWRKQQLKLLEAAMEYQLDKEILQDRIDYLIKNANDVVLLLDDKGKIIQANDKAVITYGYAIEELISLNIADIRAEDTIIELDNDMQKVREQGGYIFETVHLKKDGTRFPVEISSRMISIKAQKYFQSIIRDISERKRYEEKLKSTIAELNRSNWDLEQFAFIASHDLQEPLRMVSNFTQLLSKRYGGRLDEDADTMINYAVEGAKRMHELINALLEYSKISSSPGSFERIDLNDAVHSALENLSLQITESHTEITFNDLPVLNANYALMVQLFQNLISNAIKYRSSDSPKIKISCMRNSKFFQFSLEDNGIGISEEYFEKIFMIFQRLHAKDQFPGTGIGLTICKKIVEHHGGKIWVESEEGHGTTFYFTLPDKA